MIAAAKPSSDRPHPTARQRALQARRELARQLHDRPIDFIGNANFESLRIDKQALDRMVHAAPEDRCNGRLAMPAHLERMCNTPLLTADEERQLFRAMNFLKYQADLLRSSLSSTRPSVRKMEQVREALSLALKVRNRIVNSNTRLVISIVRGFSDSVCSFDDLLSEGIACLVNAVEKFDYDRGYRFSTYATSAVRRELFRLVQRRHRDRSRYATGTSEILDHSWQAPENPNRGERVLREMDARVASLLDTLDERERFIVRARYGFIDLGAKPTFQRLGRELGVSKERVRQLEIRAIGKLQRLAEETKLESVYL